MAYKQNQEENKTSVSCDSRNWKRSDKGKIEKTEMKLINFFWLYVLRDEISKFTVRSELQMFDTVRGLEVGRRSGTIASLRRGRAEWNRWTNWLWECWTSEEKMGDWFMKYPYDRQRPYWSSLMMMVVVVVVVAASCSKFAVASSFLNFHSYVQQL